MERYYLASSGKKVAPEKYWYPPIMIFNGFKDDELDKIIGLELGLQIWLYD